METAVLHIERAPDGLRDRAGSYEVMVNGELRAKLRRGEKEAIEVRPGSLEVYLKISWCTSRAVTLNLEPGSEARLRCRPRSLFAAPYGITFGRKSYIQLESDALTRAT